MVEVWATSPTNFQENQKHIQNYHPAAQFVTPKSQF